MDLMGFLDRSKQAFSELGYVNKCIVLAAAGYVSIQLSRDILKLTKSSLACLKKGEKRHSPTDASFDSKKFYLVMLPRKMLKQAPNLSPFVIKVETWLRLMGIEYEVVETMQLSSATAQIPYLYHNGKEVTDSDFIIEYIERELGLNTTEGLSEQDLGAARALVKMAEDSLTPTLSLHRYVYDFSNFSKVCSVPMKPEAIADHILKKYSVSGLARKSREDVYSIGREDIRAISRFLGNKSFLMGEKITKVDCAIFAPLCQIVCVDFYFPQSDVLFDECTNIRPYIYRIKSKIWPDWDEVVKSK